MVKMTAALVYILYIMLTIAQNAWRMDNQEWSPAFVCLSALLSDLVSFSSVFWFYIPQV